MQGRAPIETEEKRVGNVYMRVSRLKLVFVIVTLAVTLAVIVILGVARLFQSLSDSAISPWRLVVLFAHVFACVAVLFALYGRGRATGKAAPLPKLRGRRSSNSE
jgi:hypothetical protein